MILRVIFSMTIDPSTDSQKEDQSNFIAINEKKVECKDGFCFLPNQDDTQKVRSDNVNIFDPV